MTKLELLKKIRKNIAINIGIANHNLEGYCLVCSISTYLAFEKYKFKSSICEGFFYKQGIAYHHYWVCCYRTYYDITATQFNSTEVKYPDVFICSDTFKNYEFKKTNDICDIELETIRYAKLVQTLVQTI